MLHTIPALVHVDDVDIPLTEVAALIHNSALLKILTPDVPLLTLGVPVYAAHFLLLGDVKSFDVELDFDADVIERVFSARETRDLRHVLVGVGIGLRMKRRVRRTDGRRRDIGVVRNEERVFEW